MKKILLYAAQGAPVGLAIGYAITILVSFFWGGGEYLAVMPPLAEAVGSEAAAVAAPAGAGGRARAGVARPPAGVGGVCQQTAPPVISNVGVQSESPRRIPMPPPAPADSLPVMVPPDMFNVI